MERQDQAFYVLETGVVADGTESLYVQPAVFTVGFKQMILNQLSRGGS